MRLRFELIKINSIIFDEKISMQKKIPHGGKRDGAGRKPIKDKKVMVGIYPNQSRVDAIGTERIKEISLTAIEKEFQFLKKS